MKNFLFLFSLVVIIDVLPNASSCSKHRDPDEDNNIAQKIKLDTVHFQHSMKGWEVYSWPNGKNYEYSFLIGTDRTKSYEEVVSNKLIVSGTDSLILLLSKLPEEEYVFLVGQKWLQMSWKTNYYDLALPDSNTINSIKDYCNKRNLLLMVNE